MIGELRRFLLDHSSAWGLPADGEWSPLWHNNYHPHCSNLNVLWFHNSDTFPRVVTKLYHTATIPDREYDNLRFAYTHAPEIVPKPLHCGSQNGFSALWMGGLSGLRVEPHDCRRPAVLKSLTETVLSFHAAVKQRSEGFGDRYQRSTVEPLQTLAAYGDSRVVREGCAAVAQAVSVNWLAGLPIIPQHGDLVVTNVLRHGDQWHMVDWESFGTIDLPFHDLFTLLFSALRPAGPTPENWDSALVKRIPAAVSLYAGSVGISPDDVAKLIPLILANWFHLQWSDGRKEFTRLMYQSIQHYFANTQLWNNVFVPVEDKRSEK
jgi:hypothetical protein